MAGRSCPYCLTELATDDEVHACERCGAVHHADCWTEGGGCSVFGCQSSAAESSGNGQTTSAPESSAREASDAGSRPVSQVPVSGPDDDFTIERRTDAGDSGRGGNRRIWLIVGALAAIAAIGAGAFVLLGGSDEKEKNPPQHKSPKKPKLKPGEKKAQAEREEERKLTLRLEPIWVDDPGGKWSARLPQGAGWTEPESEGDLNDDSYNPLYRTTLYGPEGFVVVDTSPADDPTTNEANYTVAGELLDPKDISSGDFALAQMISYQNGEDDCADAPCVKAMLSDGTGGGVTVWVKSGSMKEAKMIARTFADSAERDY